MQVLNNFNGVDNINGFFTPISAGGVPSAGSNITFNLTDSTQTAFSSTALPLVLNAASFGQRTGNAFDAASGGSVNFSIDSFGEPDADGDGVADTEDECPNSDLSATVVIDGCNSGVSNTLFPSGCTISDRIGECAEGATTHGQFTKCVSHLTDGLQKARVVTGPQKDAINRCAAGAHIP